MLNLNLPAYDYLLKKEGNQHFIFDTIRKKYVVLTPEEWVRQHFINYLITEYNIPPKYIQIEGGLKYNHRQKRSDILVYDNQLQPLILVECKSSFIEINQEVYFQLQTYNSKINAKYLALTNGLVHHYWTRDHNNYIKIDHLSAF